MSDWQPIETAPLDGSPVLAVWMFDPLNNEAGSETHEVVRWFSGYWDANGESRPTPTHWMPLPEAPRP